METQETTPNNEYSLVKEQLIKQLDEMESTSSLVYSPEQLIKQLDEMESTSSLVYSPDNPLYKWIDLGQRLNAMSRDDLKKVFLIISGEGYMVNFINTPLDKTNFMTEREMLNSIKTTLKDMDIFNVQSSNYFDVLIMTSNYHKTMDMSSDDYLNRKIAAVKSIRPGVKSEESKDKYISLLKNCDSNWKMMMDKINGKKRIDVAISREDLIENFFTMYDEVKLAVKSDNKNSSSGLPQKINSVLNKIRETYNNHISKRNNLEGDLW